MGKKLRVLLHTLDYRHASVGISPVAVGERFSKGYQDETSKVDGAEVDEDNGEDVIELQNARTTAMGVGNCSVPIKIVKHLSVPKRSGRSERCTCQMRGLVKWKLLHDGFVQGFSLHLSYRCLLMLGIAD